MRVVLAVWLGAMALYGGETDPVSRARALAKDHRAEALQILDERLKADPEDSDARTLRGTIYSWDRRYDEARADLRAVLSAHPDYGDARQALLNVELWSDHPAEAERLARAELARNPRDVAMLVARARALRAMSRFREAHEAAAQALRVDPGNRAAKELNNAVGPASFEVMVSHTSDWFSDGRAPWREDQLSLSHPTAFGTVIGRISDASRFGFNSRLGEIDFYPHIRRGMYAYVNIGFSPDANLYPRYRGAFDLYQSLPGAWEVSGGYRRLSFGSGINIYTAAATKYRGRWAFTARTYLIPDNTGVSRSMQFVARRYIGEGRNYWTIRGGLGASPAGVNNVTDIGVLKSSSILGEFAHTLTRRLAVLVQAGVAKQDRIDRTGLLDTSASISLYCRI